MHASASALEVFSRKKVSLHKQVPLDMSYTSYCGHGVQALSPALEYEAPSSHSMQVSLAPIEKVLAMH